MTERVVGALLFGYRHLSASFGSSLRGFRAIDTSKQAIIWGLLLLVLIYMTGIWVISSLNLSFSQRAMGELRGVQLQEAFYANLDRINAQHQLFERHAEELASLGEVFWQLQTQNNAGLQQTLGDTLRERLGSFPGAIGIGIWYDIQPTPDANAMAGAFAYRSETTPAEKHLLMQTQLQKVRQQSWFKETIPDTRTLVAEQQKSYWTPAYYNPFSQAAVLTLVKPLYNAQGRPIGIASVDWHAEQIIALISQVSVTPNTFAYLIDRNNRKLSGFNQMEKPERATRVMDVIQQQRVIDDIDNTRPLLSGLATVRAQMKTRQLEVEGEEYTLSYAATRAGMLFGIGVPRNEIDAVLSPMRTGNYKILLFTGVVMLLLSALILFRVFALMRQLQASYMDRLTRLPNRARLLIDMDDNPLRSLVLINLDDFKEVNGLFGHRYGDEVLKAAAIWLARCLSSMQHIAPWQLYRVTADEFAILTAPMPKEQMLDMLDTIQQFIQEQWLVWQQQEMRLRLTLGATIEDGDGAEPATRDNLLVHAEYALKQARHQQKGVALYEKQQRVEETYAQNLLWAGRLRDALGANRILPYFQPIYDNGTERITKYECLVRMQLEDGGIASPGQFLGIASKIRLYKQITQVMVDKAFARFAGQPYDFSINLSYQDLLDDELTARILDKLDSTAMGSQVIFELLESDGIENYQQVRCFIDEAKARGCRIAIDDFGSGYSNFEHLLRLNVDIIKIDGSLIRHLDTDSNAYKVTQGIVQFAHNLKIATVAEFVHSELVQDKVKSLGIDFSQGALISMPQAELVSEPEYLHSQVV